MGPRDPNDPQCSPQARLATTEAAPAAAHGREGFRGVDGLPLGDLELHPELDQLRDVEDQLQQRQDEHDRLDALGVQ